jgi:putative membrane-bound dehydrogenase-like protein
MSSRPGLSIGSDTGALAMSLWLRALLTAFLLLLAFFSSAYASLDDEALLFTPPGFTKPGQPKAASGSGTGTVRIVVVDSATEKPTPCRLNVVGPDGNFYQPEPNRLSPFSLTGRWPRTGKGNREGKAPYRYYGRFFYCTGRVEVKVPAGPVLIDAAKGFEHGDTVKRVDVAAGRISEVTLRLDPPGQVEYVSGDPHLHFPRRNEADDQIILDLLEAEDVHYGSILAYNEPAGPYHGLMETMDAPQLRGLGKASVARRGQYLIASGQEYRSRTYGHLNLFWRDGLVLSGQKVNADNWPLYGQLERETRQQGGYAIYAHGGYAQAIYADAIQKKLSAVELLQFGVYRGIELADWYAMLNIGYRLPIVGASDYPACRVLADCRTYVHIPHPADSPRNDPPTFDRWLEGAAAGRSFVTTGPLLRLELDGHKPGDVIAHSGKGPHRLGVAIALSGYVPASVKIQIIANGKVVRELALKDGKPAGLDIRFSSLVDIETSSWIAARAFSTSMSGLPDSEAHTNPIYVDIDGKAPHDRAALDRLVARIDGQMALHRKRDFAEKAKVLDEFQNSRDILLRIREAGGLPAGGVPSGWLEDKTAQAFDPTVRAHTDIDLERFLKSVPGKAPGEAMKTFETVDGFHMELVAAEPLVASPVAAAFDADGNLYVAEMRDYPYKPGPNRKPLGTVRLLRDTDGNGTFDDAHVFADELLWAAGIAPWKGGVFVSAPPDLWYLKDTDGDFKADIRRKVYTGFGTQNQQAMVNNLAWGLDHKIYGSAAQNGGMIRPADRPDAPGVSINGSDFRFDPVTGAFEPITGAVQFGNSFDDWGNRFLCNESHPLLQPVLPRHYLDRNPALAVSSAIQDIVGGSVPIFRISPIERWRQIRSSRRVAHGERSASSAGASHHVVDAGAGVTVYRGSAYPAELYGNIFVGDAQNNLVHHRVLTTFGATFKAERAPREQTTEFVRSSDNWFRPVNFVNAPDGTLYVLDMSREILEAIHIPLDVVKHLDLKSGRKQGRIYRLAPSGFRYVPAPRLSGASTVELVTYLKRLDAWYRDTVMRLIYERQDQAAVEPLRRLLAESSAPLPQTRVDVLWTLQGLGALRDEELALGLKDKVPQVRAQALVLAEPRLETSSGLRARALELAEDPDARVRFQAAFSLGATRDPRAVTALASILQKDGADRWIKTAVLSSCGGIADRLFAELWNNPNASAFAGGDAILTEILDQLVQIVGVRGHDDEIARVLDGLTGIGRTLNTSLRMLRDRLIIGVGTGLRRSGRHLPVAAHPSGPGLEMIAQLVSEAIATARDEKISIPLREQAIDLLGFAPSSIVRSVLAAQLDPRQPREIQIAALRALAEGGDRGVFDLLYSRFPGFAPEVRSVALDVLLGRESWSRAVLEAASQQKTNTAVTPAMIEPARRAALLKHRDPAIAHLARDLFQGPGSSSRARVVADYAASLQLKGSADRGRQVFTRECKSCHKIGEVGMAVGPDLTGSPTRDSAALLSNILDPNSYVLPGYMQYIVSDRDGRTYTGIIGSETGTSLTLRRGDGQQDTLLRSQIDAITGTGQSLMPEGLEKMISRQEMADLIAFLRSSHRGVAQDEEGDRAQLPRLDIGTLPGLIEPED